MKKDRFDEVVDKRVSASDFGAPAELTPRERKIALVCMIALVMAFIFILLVSFLKGFNT